MKILLTLILPFLTILNSLAQTKECGCDYMIPLSTHYNWDGSHVKAGSTICFEAGVRRSPLVLKNIVGTKEKPILIKNCNGKILFDLDDKASFGLKTIASKHFRLTGTGVKAIKYGIEIKGGNIGMQLTDLSTDFEVDHIEIHHVGFAGIMAKTDPSCDKRTWRENFTMKDVSIHDNHIFYTKSGEGLYIGNSFYAGGVNKECGKVYPHKVVDLKVYNNWIHDTGAEGIQVGCAVLGCEVFSNIVERAGVNPFNGRSNQQNGIQLGEGTGGLCYNNIVKDASANAIIVLGRGDNLIFNNLLIRPKGAGLFIDERMPSTKTGAGTGFYVINNTIINTGKHGVWIYAEKVEKNIVQNNIIVNPASGQYISSRGCPGKPNIKASNNLKTLNIAQVKFINPNKDDFRLQDSSPALGAGVNFHKIGIGFDRRNKRRPSSGAFDLGAYHRESSQKNGGK